MEVKLAMLYLIIGAIVEFSYHPDGNPFTRIRRFAACRLRARRNAGQTWSEASSIDW